jgi:hypothetical protein
MCVGCAFSAYFRYSVVFDMLSQAFILILGHLSYIGTLVLKWDLVLLLGLMILYVICVALFFFVPVNLV